MLAAPCRLSRSATCPALHRLLQRRAQAHKRSLSQQALADLEAVAGGDPQQRCQEVLDRIARRAAQQPPFIWEQTPSI